MKMMIPCLLVVGMSPNLQAQIATPTGLTKSQVNWQIIPDKTDDFESSGLNQSKWENAPKSLNVGAWTFSADNAYVKNGKLNIKATQETHTRRFQDSCWDGKAGGSSKAVNRELYYKSGAVRTKTEGVYGFYEAKIKGVKVFPGLSPAFWLYSDGHPFPDKGKTNQQYVDYSEIDIVELQQADWHGPGPDDADPINVTDHNLHARVEENGKIVWKRPKPNRDTQLLNYRAPFDPSAGFHTYAVENRKDKISWFVDGVLVGEQVNTWWHRPMHLIFSMGLRRQFIHYNPDCQRADPNPNHVVSEGFPEDATMQVEYVKTWQALPSIWIKNSDIYTSTKFNVTQPLKVEVGYHGGSNDHIANSQFNGITVKLVEKNADGLVKVISSSSDPSVLSENKRYGGAAVISLDISKATPTKQLTKGHYYQLVAVFKSSNGQDIYPKIPVKNIQIVN